MRPAVRAGRCLILVQRCVLECGEPFNQLRAAPPVESAGRGLRGAGWRPAVRVRRSLHLRWRRQLMPPVRRAALRDNDHVPVSRLGVRHHRWRCHLWPRATSTTGVGNAGDRRPRRYPGMTGLQRTVWASDPPAAPGLLDRKEDITVAWQPNEDPGQSQEVRMILRGSSRGFSRTPYSARAVTHRISRPRWSGYLSILALK